MSPEPLARYNLVASNDPDEVTEKVKDLFSVTQRLLSSPEQPYYSSLSGVALGSSKLLYLYTSAGTLSEYRAPSDHLLVHFLPTGHVRNFEPDGTETLYGGAAASPRPTRASTRSAATTRPCSASSSRTVRSKTRCRR